MDLRDIEYRYLHDATLKAFIDALENMMEQLELTPTEVRQACLFACMRVELRHPLTFLNAKLKE